MTRASLPRIQLPIVTTGSKGAERGQEARATGGQSGLAERKTQLGPYTEKGGGGKGFRYPPLGKEKAKDILCFLHYSPAPRKEPDT